MTRWHREEGTMRGRRFETPAFTGNSTRHILKYQSSMSRYGAPAMLYYDEARTVFRCLDRYWLNNFSGMAAGRARHLICYRVIVESGQPGRGKNPQVQGIRLHRRGSLSNVVDVIAKQLACSVSAAEQLISRHARHRRRSGTTAKI